MYSDQTKDKLKAYFIERWGMWEYTRGWLKSNCPFCGKPKKFGVQIDDNKVHCFSCEHNKGLFATIIELENLKIYNDVYNILNTYRGRSERQIFEKVVDRRSTDVLTLPDDFKLVGLYTNRVAQIVEQNLTNRGFKIEKLMRAGVGYCIEGKYEGRIIIPYYEDGNLVYFNARRFLSIGEKFKNPTKDDCGIGKTDVIYNVDALSLYDKVFLFEGAMNALTIGPNASGLGGKNPSAKQISKIIQSPASDLIIGLDDDAYSYGLKLGMELVNFKRIKVLKFPPKLDANDLGRKATIELSKNTPWQSYHDLYKLYINEKRAVNTY